jgi:nitrogen regulatory protein PII
VKEIIAIIRPEKAMETKLALEKAGVSGYTTSRVLGRSRQGGLRYARKWFRRSADIRFLPKRLFWIVVEDHQLPMVMDAFLSANQTGKIGDGKIFVLPVEEAVRIRPENAVKEALR